jgi:hypothetical protein
VAGLQPAHGGFGFGAVVAVGGEVQRRRSRETALPDASPPSVTITASRVTPVEEATARAPPRIAAAVSGPTMPSTARPCADWNERTADSVSVP